MYLHLIRVPGGRIDGKEILTPAASLEPRTTGAAIYGVRPGKPIHFHVSATGVHPLEYHATGLPDGVRIDPETGWISGRVPQQVGDTIVGLEVRNTKGVESGT